MTDGLALALRVALSLGGVLGLIALLARGGARRGFGQGRRSVATVEIVARQGLQRNASVVVLRAAGRGLVLGVTESSIALLAEVDEDLLLVDDDADEVGRARIRRTKTGNTEGIAVARTSPQAGLARIGTWRTALDSMRELTVRRA